jgi:hypothetical protein
MRTLRERFEAKWTPEPYSGCWLWTGCVQAQGYGRFWKNKHVRAHRVAWELHHGAVPSGMHVLHSCDTASCVNPGHLFLGTDSDNRRDCVKKVRHAFGARSAGVKLTESQIREIRIDQRSLRKIAKDYGVSYRAIGYIKNRITWKHVC